MVAELTGPDLDASLGALSDREREILGLLTAGHTVKSIAGLLGRSEASINERLRDARRKTGIGSSRELARLHDAWAAGQKNRDEKIDLHTADGGADQGSMPPRSGWRLSRGAIAMLILLPAIALGGLLSMTDSPWRAAAPDRTTTAAAAPSPLVGRWALDVARIPAEERPRGVTIAFATGGDRKWTTDVEITAPDGSVMKAHSTAATDGVAVPVSGNFAAIDTASLRQPAPNTLVMTLGKGGQPISTRVYAVAKDRRTMTETIVWAGKDLPKLETTVFRRIE